MRSKELHDIAPRWAPALLLLIAALSAATSLSWLQFGRDAWRLAQRPAMQQAAPVSVRFAIAGEVWTIPPDLIRFPAAGMVSPARVVPTPRIELALTWPQSSATRVRLALIARADPVSAHERFERLYQPYFEGDEIAGPDGLVGRRLAAASGYGGETLFFDPAAADPGEEPFVIRCDTAEDGNLAPATCFRRLSLSPRLQLEMRYRIGLLKDWRKIEATTADLIATFRRTGEPPR